MLFSIATACWSYGQICVWEGLVMWASVNVAVSPPPVCICWGFVFSTHADLLLEASLQWPSSHMRCECINASSISSISVTECLFGGAWCQAVFITGLSQRDHSCFFFFFLLLPLSPPLLSTLNLLMSVECMAVHSKFL